METQERAKEAMTDKKARYGASVTLTNSKGGGLASPYITYSHAVIPTAWLLKKKKSAVR